MVRYHSDELATMSKLARSEALTALVSATRNGASEVGASILDARIRQYELRYEMTSAQMREKFASGGLRETAEISQWLFLVGARDSHVTG